MARSVSIAAAQGLRVRLANKSGFVFHKASDVADIARAAVDQFSAEQLVALAMAKVGAGNISTLSGRTVTLVLDVVIT